MTTLRLSPEALSQARFDLAEARLFDVPDISRMLEGLTGNLREAWSGAAQTAFEAEFSGWSRRWGLAGRDLGRVCDYLQQVLDRYQAQEQALIGELDPESVAPATGSDAPPGSSFCPVELPPAPRSPWEQAWFEFQKAVIIAAAHTWWWLDDTVGDWGRRWHMERLVTGWALEFANANPTWDFGLDIWQKRWTPDWMALRASTPWIEMALALKPSLRIVQHGAGDDLTFNPGTGILQVSDAASITRVDIATNAVSTRLINGEATHDFGSIEVPGLGPVGLTYKIRNDAGIGLEDITQPGFEANASQRLILTVKGVDFVIGLDAAVDGKVYPGPTGLTLAPVVIPTAVGAAATLASAVAASVPAAVTATGTALAAFLSQCWNSIQPALQYAPALP